MTVLAIITIVKEVSDKEKAKDFYEQIRLTLIPADIFFSAANITAGKMKVQLSTLPANFQKDESS